ncbi:MAG: type III-A CRISPR-associated RAMP protein Csm5 [Acidobacteriota bacterium]|jgi:CRISPR-associated protein Csm5|nr:type III-A CRISPR-associated RAMP protein Csm5 [Acidobacteriota bacterium]
MKEFLKTYTIRVTPLSPIHIGCGEDFEPTNYVIDKKKLYTFDPVRLLLSLGDEARREFSCIVDKNNSLREIQEFFYKYKETALRIGVSNADVVEEAQKFYDSRIGKITQREDTVLNKLEIARTAFNPCNNQPILPGSSVKGAIRTALLDKCRNDKRYVVKTKEGIRDLPDREIRKEAERQCQLMIQDRFQKNEDFFTDPLRFIKIGDGASQETIRTRICFQVNRKKHPNNYRAGGNINTLLECISGNMNQFFTTQWSIEMKDGNSGQLPKLQFDFSGIAEACHTFYYDRFKAECAVLEENHYADNWVHSIENHLKLGGKLDELVKKREGFLLRVGRHSGAESVTVDAPRSIKIMKGRGQHASYAEKTTTLWLAADRKNQWDRLKPFGWVFVQIVP